MGDLATLLIGARRASTLIAAVPPAAHPTDLAHAYAIAARVAATLGPIGGIKVGATSPRALAMLGLSEPFAGVIPRDRILAHPATWPATTPVTLDAELLFDLAHIPQDPTDAALRRAVRAVHLGIEINAPRYARPFDEGALCIVADNGANAGLVIGPKIDPDSWPDTAATLVIDGVPGPTARVADALGNPWDILRWCLGGPIRPAPDMMVASGNIAFAQAAPGQNVTADFGAGGQVSVRIA